MAGPRGGATKPRRHAYNAHVAKHRQEKYYERKKVHRKFRIMQNYEKKHEAESLGTSAAAVKAQNFLERILSEGADTLNDEYEERLAASYGGSKQAAARETGTNTKKKKTLKKRQQPEGEASARAGDTESLPAAGAPLGKSHAGLRGKKRVRSGSPAAAEADGVSAVPPTRGETEDAPRSRKRARSGPPAAVEGKQTQTALAQNEDTLRQAGRFAKEVRAYQDAMAQAAAEKQKRLEDFRQHKKRRRESAKGRAAKGQQLSQRNHRGQPVMQSILEAVTAKLGRT